MSIILLMPLSITIFEAQSKTVVMLEHCTHRSIERFTAEWATRT